MPPTEWNRLDPDFPRIARLVGRALGVPLDQVTRSTRLNEDLGLDAYDVLELLDAVEAASAVHIDSDDSCPLRTVADIERVLARSAALRRPVDRAEAARDASVQGGSPPAREC